METNLNYAPNKPLFIYLTAPVAAIRYRESLKQIEFQLFHKSVAYAVNIVRHRYSTRDR